MTDNEKHLTQTKKSTQHLTNLTSKNGNLFLPHPKEDRIVEYDVDFKTPAHKQREFVKAITVIIDSTRSEPMSTTETQLMRLSLRRHNVKPLELYQAMLDAWEDAYTPNTGVEWKHIFKQIKQRRENTYTPPENS